MAIIFSAFVAYMAFDILHKPSKPNNPNLSSYWSSAEEQCEEIAKAKGYSHYALSGFNVDYFLGIITTCNVSKKPYGTPEDAFSVRVEMKRNMQFKEAKR